MIRVPIAPAQFDVLMDLRAQIAALNAQLDTAVRMVVAGSSEPIANARFLGTVRDTDGTAALFAPAEAQ